MIFAACIGMWGRDCVNNCSYGYYGHGCRKKCDCDFQLQICNPREGCVKSNNILFTSIKYKFLRLQFIQDFLIPKSNYYKLNY